MDKPIRVLLLTQWFDPEPTFKGLVFARELVQQGFDIEVVTGFPNYPGGKIYPGYKIKWQQHECIDGVHITRLPLYPSHDQSALRRILNYISFGVSTLIYGLFIAKKPDVIYAYHPPLTVGIAARLIRLFRRIPVVYDIQDMWPDTLRASGMLHNTHTINIVDAVCRWVYCGVSHIVVLSPGFKHLLLERGVPEQKISVIYNWSDENAISTPQGPLPKEFEDKDRFNILFAGNMGKAQALETVIHAAAILEKDRSKVRFIFLGGGVSLNALKEKSQNLGLTNVIFIPAVPMSTVGTYLKQADVLLVHLRKDPLFSITIPSKIQAYLASGRPILVGVEGDASALIEESEAGISFVPEDPVALVDAVLEITSKSQPDLQKMGDSGKDFYQKHLSIKSGVSAFAKLFNEVVKKDRKIS